MKLTRYFLVCYFLIYCSINHAELFKPEEHKMTVTEYDIKAFFLAKMSFFVDWPNHITVPYHQLCLLGEIPRTFLESLYNDGTIRNIQGITPQAADYVTQVSKCHILFISRSEQERLLMILSSIQHLPILTVSDIGDFTSLGGMIEFYKENKKIHLKLNPEAASKVGFKMSSRLLRIATKIVQTNEDKIATLFTPQITETGVYHSEKVQPGTPLQNSPETIVNDHDVRPSERIPKNSEISPSFSTAKNAQPLRELPSPVRTTVTKNQSSEHSPPVKMNITNSQSLEKISKNNIVFQQTDDILKDAEQDLSIILMLSIVILALFSVLVILGFMTLLKAR